MTRRQLHPQLRLVVPAAERADRRPTPPVPAATVPFPAELTGCEIDTHIDPYIHCGRYVIGAAVAAIVDAAAAHGLEGGPWDPDDVRREIVDIVTRRMHDTIISHITQSGIDPNAAAHHSGPVDSA